MSNLTAQSAKTKVVTDLVLQWRPQINQHGRQIYHGIPGLVNGSRQTDNFVLQVHKGSE